MTARFDWEDRVQGWVRTFYEAVGFHVYDLSQGYRPGGKRHSSTRQTPGIPDLILVSELFRVTVFHETKAFTAKELHPLVDRSRWRDAWHSQTTWRLAMLQPDLYRLAVSQVDPIVRQRKYLEKRTSDQILLEKRLIGQLGIVYACGAVEEAHACVAEIKLHRGGGLEQQQAKPR